jgi:hypothetical protein
LLDVGCCSIRGQFFSSQWRHCAKRLLVGTDTRDVFQPAAGRSQQVMADGSSTSPQIFRVDPRSCPACVTMPSVEFSTGTTP